MNFVMFTTLKFMIVNQVELSKKKVFNMTKEDEDWLEDEEDDEWLEEPEQEP